MASGNKDLCQEHEKSIIETAATVSTQTRAVDALINKIDAMMDHIVVIKADIAGLQNGVTVKIVEEWERRTGKLRKWYLLAIALVGAGLGILQLAFDRGWI